MNKLPEINLIGREIDLEKFATMPKCIGVFKGYGGSGCLLTAFWYALGFDIRKVIYEFDCDHLIRLLKKATEKLADYHEIKYEKTTSISKSKLGVNVNLNYSGFTGSIMGRYDNGQETEALNLLWELIEKMPKKNTVNKGQVVMPVCKVV